jgi:hypothetical protein
LLFERGDLRELRRELRIARLFARRGGIDLLLPGRKRGR